MWLWLIFYAYIFMGLVALPAALIVMYSVDWIRLKKRPTVLNFASVGCSAFIAGFMLYLAYWVWV